MPEEKPHWMKDHEADDQRNFTLILESLQRLEDKIYPVHSAYTTATALGRWTKVLGSAILMGFALWAAFKNFN